MQTYAIGRNNAMLNDWACKTLLKVDPDNYKPRLEITLTMAMMALGNMEERFKYATHVRYDPWREKNRFTVMIAKSASGFMDYEREDTDNPLRTLLEIAKSMM